MDSTEYVQIATTFESEDDAKKVAGALVDKRFVACAQILGPLTSIYRWQGKVELATEWQCLMKTTKASQPEAVSLIQDLHPYEEPEIVVFPIVDGSSGYLAWIQNNCKLDS